MAQLGYAKAAPTDTTQYWDAGAILLNSAPASGQAYGWVCVTAGFPGTWAVITLTPQNVLVTTLTSGTLADGNRLILFNGAATSNQLPNPANHAGGFLLTIKNIASASLTLTAGSSFAYVDATAITMTQNQFINLVANSTNWYKVG